jgi:hypothetical protein
LDLSISRPASELTFSANGKFHICGLLEVHQAVDSVAGSKAGQNGGAMIVDPLKKVAGHPHVEPTESTGENVDGEDARHWAWMMRGLDQPAIKSTDGQEPSD